MATRLLKHGWPVASCANRNREPIEALKELGLTEARKPKEVAASSDIVITMVRDTSQSERVIFGVGSVLDGLRKGATLIIMSTIGGI